MEDKKKVYGMCCCPSPLVLSHHSSPGFTLSLYEYESTIPTLWEAVKGMWQRIEKNCIDDASYTEFMKENPETLAEDNAMKFISDDGGETYNRCHCAYDLYYMVIHTLI